MPPIFGAAEQVQAVDRLLGGVEEFMLVGMS